MKRNCLLIISLCLLITASVKAQTTSSEKQNEYTLFYGKKTNYRIAINATASTSEQWAAKELQHWLKEVSGADFPVSAIGDLHAGPQII